MDSAFDFAFNHPDFFIARTTSTGHARFIKTIGIQMSDAFVQIIRKKFLSSGPGVWEPLFMLPWYCSFVVEMHHLGVTSESLHIKMFDGSRSSPSGGSDGQRFMGSMWINMVHVNMAVRRPQPLSTLQRKPFLHLPNKPELDLNMEPMTIPKHVFQHHKQFTADHIDSNDHVRWNDHVISQYQCLIASQLPELNKVDLRTTTLAKCKMLYVADITGDDIYTDITFALWLVESDRLRYQSVVTKEKTPLAYCDLQVLTQGHKSNL